ncbi:UDP-N-acetylmuramoyl-L-alanyl-D-glutamate--2,6-diaminopimelate ligase [Agrococcus sp. SCSIO52902]|nr:UDP-N-acetylmuramoyl-L-alanyl-D-glutamate--2,6-diaminopimelate ligase [Agrococcus sp. SCSIO52902]UOW00214.1 UDP-N-acetylmuramoyl-L-alanyl-D-glutamate--2,6-diaminopimelate ligase [Agrococcus sp. SCSIO52902]
MSVAGVTPRILRPEHPAPRPLTGLVEAFELEERDDLDGVEVTGITIDSSDVQPGDIFAALPGAHRHGAEFAAGAVERGAVAVVTDPAGAGLVEADVPVIVVDDPRAALGEIAAWVYRTEEHPPKLFGITGTNGKTSTSFMLEGLLADLGFVTGLSTTAERHVGDVVVTSKLTTPEASELHALLARMREAGVRAAVLEVSAQALERHRVDGVRFDVVAFTNLSHDHLDDYGSMEAYFDVKLELFTPDRAERGVVCVDGDWGVRVAERSRIPVTTLSSDPQRQADWHVDIWEETPTSTSFTLTGIDGGAIEVQVPFIGRHMAVDAAIAILMLVEAGFELEAIAEVIDRGMRSTLPGRIERVSGDEGPAVFVDYGHSPDAFAQTLEALRRVTEGRLIMLFGADGDRDATKRADMGRIAAELADAVVVTDFNPRTEDPAAIRAQVLAGARAAAGGKPVIESSPEEAAIRAALELAGPGDTVLWAGPGDADYRDVAGVREAFVARDEARRALQEAGWPVRDDLARREQH